MSRVPKTRARAEGRARKTAAEAVFEAAPGSRLIAGGLCAVLTALFVIHQTQIEGMAPALRAFAVFCAAFFGALAWYFLKRGSRRGPVLRIGPEGFGIALGFDTWRDFTWDEVEAFRYWEPTGMQQLVKRRQSRWVGVLLKGKLKGGNMPLDARFEIWLNTFHNRPGLCILHPFVRADILDVLQAFKDHAPRELDDYEWMSK
jgi:hypothetical protein